MSNPIPITSAMDGRGSCVSISDTNGNLILYAATLAYLNNDWGTRIFNSQNQILQGCDSITGVAWYNELITIPKPNHANQYYVFSVGLDDPNNQGCYYTLVDMSLNGGLGGVVFQNIQINNQRNGDCLTAVKHGNGRDWWILSKYSNTSATFYNRFYIYLVTPDSIYTPIIQDFNDATDVDFQKIIWNSTGNKFMLINIAGYMSEFDFDRCSGTITLNKNIYPEQTSNYDRLFIFGAYSPNDSIFYASTLWWTNIADEYLLQFDLTASNIPASCDTLSVFQTPIESGALRLAPDGKVYFSHFYDCYCLPMSYPYPDSVRNYVNENLSVINQPNNLGAACDYQPFSFYLGGKRTYYGLPNNPNYSLGAISPCDTILSTNEIQEKNEIMMLTPNPTTNIVYLNAKHVKGSVATITIHNSFGAIIFQKQKNVFDGGNVTDKINLSQFTNGIYFLQLRTEKESLSQKIIKE